MRGGIIISTIKWLLFMRRVWKKNNPNCQLTAVYISVVVYSYVYCLYEIVSVSFILNMECCVPTGVSL